MSLTRVTNFMIDGAKANVLDYGAVGDGVTDDSAAIQNAVNAGANEVFFPAGTYIVTEPIQIPANVSLRGAGKGITTIQCGTVDPSKFGSTDFSSSVESKNALLNFLPGALPQKIADLNTDASKGDQDIELASAHGLTNGDVILLIETSQRLIVESIASGPFTVGETITGGTSGATGTIRRIEVSGTNAYIDYTPVSGEFQPYSGGPSGTETITGGSSGATATTIWRGASFCPHRTVYAGGQFLLVTNSSSSTVFRISGSVLNDFYANTTEVWKINQPTKSSISKMSVVGPGTNDIRPYGISAIYAHGFTIDDVEVRRFFYTNVEFRLCFQSRVVNSIINQNYQYVLGAGDFYGIVISNSTDIQVANCSISAARHAVATGGFAYSANLPNPSCMELIISDCTLSSNGEIQAADFHGNTAYSSYRDCTINGGISMGGAFNSVEGCLIVCNSQDVQSSVGVYFSELVSTGMRIVNNHIIGYGTSFTTSRGLLYVSSGVYSRRGSTIDNTPLIIADNKIEMLGGNGNGVLIRFSDSGYVGIDKGYSVIIDNNMLITDNRFGIQQLTTTNYLPINLLTVTNNTFETTDIAYQFLGEYVKYVNFSDNTINNTGTTSTAATCLFQAKEGFRVNNNTIRRAPCGGFSFDCENTQTLPCIVTNNIVMDYGYNLNASNSLANGAFNFFRDSGGTSENRVFFSSNRVLSAQSTAQSAFRYAGDVLVIERNNVADFPAPSGGNWISFTYSASLSNYEFEDATYGDLTGATLRSGKTTLTIASGEITATRSFHLLTGEGGAADDLVTINGGSDGQILVLRASSDSVTITVKDTGNIATAGSDVTLDNEKDTVTLMYDSALTKWLELARSNNGA